MSDGRSSVAGLQSAASEMLALAAESQVPFLAAALAYYGFVSLVPLVVLGVAVATAFGGEALASGLLSLVGEALTPSGESLIRSAILGTGGRGSVTILGLLLLVWGSLKSFRGFDHAFSVIYGSSVRKSVVDTVVDSAIVLVGVGAGALLVVAIQVAVLSGALGEAVGPLALFGSLAVVFLPVYYRFPDVDQSVASVLPGVAFAAAGWTVLGAVFQLYVTALADPTLYGLLGVVLIVLTWFYLGALLVLLGAVVNAVRWSRSTGGHR